MDRIPVGAIHGLPLLAFPGVPRKALAFFLLPVPPSVPTVGELQVLYHSRHNPTVRDLWPHPVGVNLMT